MGRQHQRPSHVQLSFLCFLAYLSTTLPLSPLFHYFPVPSLSSPFRVFPHFPSFPSFSHLVKALEKRWGATTPERRVLGIFDPHVALAGFAGGLGRGLVESPFEFVKVRRQVDATWRLQDVYRGSSMTLLRNSFLFSSFVTYIDLSKQLVEGGLSPFWTGAFAANLAWLTVWPLDVVKSQAQSGRFEGKSMSFLLCEAWRSGAMFRGIAPGLARSFIANGTSMVVYKKVMAAVGRCPRIYEQVRVHRFSWSLCPYNLSECSRQERSGGELEDG